MNANKAGLLLATLVFTCFASVAFSQPTVDPLLAKLNALPPDERHAALVKGAQTERVVEWYATLPVEHSKVLIEAFRQRYPFIEVQYTGAGGGRMVNRVVTEHRAGLNKFDVLGGTSTSHVALMKAGLIARNVTPVRKELRDGFMDVEGYRVAPFTYALVIGYNTRALSKEQRPRSYEELLEPKWKSQIGLEAAGYEWLAAMIDTMGEEKALAFARKLATQNLRVQQGSSLLVQQMMAGEFNVLIDALHYQLEKILKSGALRSTMLSPIRCSSRTRAASGSQNIPLTPILPRSSSIFSLPATPKKSMLDKTVWWRAKIWSGAFGKSSQAASM